MILNSSADLLPVLSVAGVVLSALALLLVVFLVRRSNERWEATKASTDEFFRDVEKQSPGDLHNAPRSLVNSAE